MKKTLFTVALFTAFLVSATNAQGTWQDGWLSRYWDGCKLDCNWNGKPMIQVNGQPIGRAGVCNRQNERQDPNDQIQSACQNSSGQYVCWDHAPVAVSATLSYAFVAVNPGGYQCGRCFEMEFTGSGARQGTKGPAPTGSTHQSLVGKRMIVMTSNIGGDVENSPIKQFDVLIPGGGVGQFDAISTQLGTNDLGHIWGGYLREPCNSSNVLATAQSCLRTQCEKLGNNLLRDGCLWHANWMGAANNPEVRWRETTCPQEMIDWYRNPKQRPAGCPAGICSGNTDPQPTTYTLTVNRNPTTVTSTINVGGTAYTAPRTINANTATAISTTVPTGFTFVNWTIAGSGATIANASNASTTVTLTANATITANFRQGTGPGPDPGGNVITVEAESLTAQLPACNSNSTSMCVSTANGITNIGYISAGNTATYNVTVPRAGTYDMAFRIALNQADVQSSGISVAVGNSSTPVGTMTTNGTGGWDTYQTVPLGGSGRIQLNQGSNTITLTFQNALNLDYFTLTGETVSIRHNAARQGQAGPARITLTAGAKGFTAALPANHTYTSYKLFDLQGRELRRGAIGDGVTNLRFDNVKNSVVFLRLEGKSSKPAVIRAVMY